MKIKKIFAALAAAAVSAVSFASMTFSTASAANPVLGNAQLIGAIGANQCWNLDDVNDLSVTAQVNGDAQYEVVWDVTATGGTDTLQFLCVLITPADGVDNFGSDTFADLSAQIDEVWIDDVKVEDYSMSADAVNTRYYEGGAGVTRLYLRDEWAGTGVADLDSATTIASNIRVKFSVSGLGVDGDSNVTEDPTASTDPTDAPTDAPEEGEDPTDAPTDAPEDGEDPTDAPQADAEGTTTTTAADDDKDDDDKKNDSKSTTTAKKETSNKKTTTKAASNGGSDEKSADTGDAGTGIAIAALALAGTAAVVSRKRK